MTSDSPPAGSKNKRAARGFLPSPSTQNRLDDGSAAARPRPVTDSYRPPREASRPFPSLGSRPFDRSAQRPVIDSYSTRVPPVGGYGHAAPKRKVSDSPKRAPDYSGPAHYGSEPNRKKQDTGGPWVGRQTHSLPDRALESPRNRSSSYSSASASSARPAHATCYHNDAYAEATRGRVVPDPYFDTYRPSGHQSFPSRSPPPHDYYDYSFSPPPLRRYASLPSLYSSQQQPQQYPQPYPRPQPVYRYYDQPPLPPPPHRSITNAPGPFPHRQQPLALPSPPPPPPPPPPQRHQHHSTTPCSITAAPAPAPLPNPKDLPPLQCTPGRIVWVKKLPNTAAAQQGWHSHPGVVFDAEDARDASPHSYAWVATTTSWRDFDGLDDKFKYASAATRAEFVGSFCAVVHEGDGERADEGEREEKGGSSRMVVVEIEGARVFEQETYVDGRAVRRVRKRELCRYLKKGTLEEAAVTGRSMERLKAHFRELARRGNGVWDRNDLRDLRAWERWDAKKERRGGGRKEESKEEAKEEVKDEENDETEEGRDGKEEGEISDEEQVEKR